MVKKDIKKKITEFFLVNPTTKLRVRQIERQAKVPLPSAIKYCKELTKEEILKVSEIAGITVYSADRTSKKFLIEKRLFNIKQLHVSGLVDFLINEFSSPPIVVFGSYSRGEDVEESDIDIYVESSSKRKIKLEKFERKLQRKIQIFIYNSFHEIKNKELANNILNGIKLNGFIEFYK